MSTPEWPATLPQYPIRDALAETAPFPVVQAPVDGPSLSRRRYTAAPAALTHQYNMSPTQFAAWETFYANDLKSGALSFIAPLRGSASTATYRLTSAPQYKQYGAGWWSVTVNLIRLP